MAQASRRDPLVLADTANLSREDWLAYRRQGIGGSDAAAVLGISPFRTAVDLYYDKRNLPIEDNESNWVAMEVGTLLEDLAAPSPIREGIPLPGTTRGKEAAGCRIKPAEGREGPHEGADRGRHGEQPRRRL